MIEQIRDREWSVDRFYKYGPMIVANPLNVIWALVDAANVTKGILFVTIDMVGEVICVNMFSVDREYQSINGGAIAKAIEFLHKFQDELKENRGINLKRKILWPTTRPRACEREGLKRTKGIMMEV